MRALFPQRRGDRMRHVEIVLPVDGDQHLVARHRLVVADEANVAVAVLSRIGQPAGQGHQPRDIRPAQSRALQSFAIGNRIAYTNAIISGIAHRASDPLLCLSKLPSSPLRLSNFASSVSEEKGVRS